MATAAVASQLPAQEAPAPAKKSRSKRIHVEVPEMVTEIPSVGMPGETVPPIMHLRGRLLGKGGFAAVYELQNMKDGRVLAGKVISKESLQKSRARQKLDTEIAIHRKLKHPHIVRFLRSFEDKTNVYLLLECCTGRTLADLLRSRMRLTDMETANLLSQTINAVQSLHDERIIHRDLKLSNLFLDQEGRIKVGDFGLACQLTHDGERKTTICGTPNYIAPEVLAGKSGHSYEVDVWSLGVILYTLLIGKPPFETSDVRSTYRRIRSNAYFFPEGIEISPEAADLIRKVLRTEPELRPSMGEMLAHPFFTRFSSKTTVAFQAPPSTAGLKPQAKSTTEPQVVHVNVWAGGEHAPGVRSGKVQPPAALQLPPAPAQPESWARTGSGQFRGNPMSREGSGAFTPGLGDSNISSMTSCPMSPSAYSMSRTGSGAFGLGLSHQGSAGSILAEAASRANSGALRGRYTPASGTPTRSMSASGMERAYSGVAMGASPGPGVPTRSSSMSSSGAEAWGTTETGHGHGHGHVLDEWDRQRLQIEKEQQDARAQQEAMASLNSQMRAHHMGDNRAESGSLSSTGTETNTASDSDYAKSASCSLRSSGYGDVKPRGGEAVAHHYQQQQQQTVAVSVRCDSAMLASLAANGMIQSPSTQRIPSGRPPRGSSAAEDTPKPKTPSTNEPNAISPSKMKAWEEMFGEETPVTSHIKQQAYAHEYSPASEASPNATAAADGSPGPATHHPTAWVTRWVDYSSKYGMGYVLSNGAVGVLFNDATKVLLLPDRSKYIYMEKTRTPQGARSHKEERTVLNSADEPPASLKKKATLLWYFEGYLKGSSFKVKSDKHPGRVSGECVGPGEPMSSAGVAAMAASAMEPIYVKKWLKTRHAIIFRLSNKVIQVDFNDETEIILSSEMQSVTYVNKARESGTHWLSHLPQDLELLKRLKYTKDILLQLIGGVANGSSSAQALPGTSPMAAQ